VRILHLTDTGLPDWRLEKCADSGRRAGHEIFFGGGKSQYSTTSFLGTHEITWTAGARRGIPFYWNSVRKQVKNAIIDTKPDVIHAHNIFSAKMVSEFGIPFVYDDYEYWSRHARVVAEADFIGDHEGGVAPTIRKIKRKLLTGHTIKLWTKWEEEIVLHHPTITVSDKIAEGHRLTSKTPSKIFVVPNYPLLSEVKDIREPEFHGNLCSVYAGSDGNATQRYKNRNIGGLFDLFSKSSDIGCLEVIGWVQEQITNVKFLGYLRRKQMFSEMSNNSIGLIPFKKHWSHPYLNPNKAYECAHAGLFVLCTSSLETIISTLKDNCMTFEGYDDLASKLRYFRHELPELHEKRLRIFEFARKNLIWENEEKYILEAYQVA
jgi:hypothetical protein